MLDTFKSYYRTVRNFLRHKNQKAYELFKENNLSENYDDHDNWNGGIDYYTIVLRIPVSDYIAIISNPQNEISEDITKASQEALKGNESIVINGTLLVPHDDDETILIPSSESMWIDDYFRLFISHVSENKISATNLRTCLYKWGIHGFVAHEDIEPSKEWEHVLHDALLSMNALCAILVKKI